MIRNFRQVFKGNQMPMTVVMVVVLLGLVAYLAPSSGAANAPETVVARVYGREITKRDLDRYLADRLQGKKDAQEREQILQTFKFRALPELVNAKLRAELAARHGIIVTDQELGDTLEAQLRRLPFCLEEDGSLRKSSEINEIMGQYGMTLHLMEQELRADIANVKLLDQAAAKVPVDEAWLTIEHRNQNEKVDLEVVTLTPDPSTVNDPGDGTLQTFLSASGARFQQPPRRVIQYVTVDQSRFESALQVSDEALKGAYESKKSEYTEMKASHILFKAQTDAEFAKATEKASALRAKLATGLDFAKTAEEQSEDPSAKGKGGDLGWFKSGVMVKPFEDAAAVLNPGEISQPVRTSFGIHLIKLEARRSKSFEEAKAELLASMRKDRFQTLAKSEMEMLRNRVGDRGDLSAAARAQNLKVEMSKPFLESSTTPIEQLPGAYQVPSQAFQLKIGQVSKVMSAGDTFLLFKVHEERPIGVPPLAEIRSVILDAWKLEEARKALRAKVQPLLATGDIKTLGGELKNQDGASIATVSSHPAVRKALLDTPEGQCTPAIWTSDRQLWIARVKKRTPPAPMDFAKRKELIQTIQQRVAADLLMTELKDLDAKGRKRTGFSSLYGRLDGIWINFDALKDMFGDADEY